MSLNLPVKSHRGWVRGRGGRGVWLAAALLLAGLSLTAAAVRAVLAAAGDEAEREFGYVCREIQNQIERRLHEHEQILRSAAAFFSDSDGVTREEWHEYAERQKVDQTLPGIQGIGFAQVVTPEQLGEHVRQIRAEGFADYQVWPAGEREIYAPIVFLEPFTGRNLRAFGYDMFSEPVRHAAMERARDQDQAALTAKVTLIQETDQDLQPGTLMYAPVYRMGARYATAAERRAAFIGWVYSPYRMRNLMEGILRHQDLVSQGRIQLCIFDGETAAPAALLYDSEASGGQLAPPHAVLTRQTIVNSTGRPWLLDFKQHDDAPAGVRDGQVWWVGSGGTLISLLLAGLALSLNNTRHQARALARRLTADLRHSEERWKFALESAGDGVWDWDVANGRMLYSKRLLEILGFGEQQLGTKVEDWKQQIHPQDLTRVMVDLDAHLDTSQPIYINEHRVRCQDGSWKWVLSRGRVMTRNAEGTALRMIGSVKDITERKQTEAELLRQSRIEHALMLMATKFVNVPRGLEDLAIHESLAMMGQLIGADLAHLFAYDFGRGIGSNTHEWCGPGVQSQTAKLQAVQLSLAPDWVAAHQRGEAWLIPSVAAMPVAEPLREVLATIGVCSLMALPLMDGETCLGFVAFDAIRDERVWQPGDLALLKVLAELYAHFEVRRAADRQTLALQHDLMAARDEAQAAAEAKGLFLANMSHEIRTPLNAILGYVQIMERENRDLPPRNRPNQNWLKAIHRSGQHLLALLNDLLELVRSDVRVVIPDPADFDFQQVLDDVRLMFVPLPEAQGKTLEVAWTPDVPQFLHADPVKIRQILVNLVGNALKFTATGGVRLTASMVAAAEDFLLTVDVEDTGCGIAADELEHIFEVFEQAERGRKSGKGTGLGLPLSRRYARALGGDVTVVQSSAAGSHFRFTFLAQAAHRTAIGHLQEAGAWAFAAPPPAPVSGLEPAMVVRLSVEQRHQLEQALQHGDVRLLREMIEHIGTEHAELAGGLRVLLDAYDYERLRGLLVAARTVSG